MLCSFCLSASVRPFLPIHLDQPGMLFQAWAKLVYTLCPEKETNIILDITVLLNDVKDLYKIW